MTAGSSGDSRTGSSKSFSSSSGSALEARIPRRIRAVPEALEQLRVVDGGHQVVARYVLQVASRGRDVVSRDDLGCAGREVRGVDGFAEGHRGDDLPFGRLRRELDPAVGLASRGGQGVEALAALRAVDGAPAGTGRAHLRRDDQHPQEQIDDDCREEVHLDRGVGQREWPPQVEVLVIEEQERGESGEADDGEFARCRPSLPRPVTAQRIPPSGPTPKESGPPQGGRTTPGGIYLLDGGRPDIKNEKEGMKYIRLPGRSGGVGWRMR